MTIGDYTTYRDAVTGDKRRLPAGGAGNPGLLDSSAAPQVDSTPGPNYAKLIAGLGGGLRSSNDAAAQQAIRQTSRRLGGDTSSPVFSMLAQNATTGAAGRTGADLAGLKLNASEAQAGRDMQTQLANLNARLQAMSLSTNANLTIRGQDLQQQATQVSQALQAAQISNSLNAGGFGFHPTTGGQAGMDILSRYGFGLSAPNGQPNPYTYAGAAGGQGGGLGG